MQIEVHSKMVEAELERLSDGPGIRDLIKFEAVLATQFTATQAKVHIDTTSLKNSGKQKSSMNRATNVWEGEIIYGGPSRPIPDVKYAGYELARGGAHDFLRPADRLSQRYRRAILDFFDGKGKRK